MVAAKMPVKKKQGKGGLTKRSATSTTNKKPADSRKKVFRALDNNDTTYWDDCAADYEDEVFCTFHENKNVKDTLDRYKDKNGICVDFGCGIGGYLPELSKRFKFVVGMDFSQELVLRAQKKAAKMKNVAVSQGDLLKSARVRTIITQNLGKLKAAASGTDKLPKPAKKPSFGICMNVLLSPDFGMQTQILATLHENLAPQGKLMLLVPSLESFLLTNFMIFRGPGRVLRSFKKEHKADMRAISQDDGLNGVMPLGGENGVRTQHYLKEQIGTMAREVGFKVLEAEKSEYSWETEIEFGANDQRAVKAFRSLPYRPWDWLLVLQKGH